MDDTWLYIDIKHERSYIYIYRYFLFRGLFIKWQGAQYKSTKGNSVDSARGSTVHALVSTQNSLIQRCSAQRCKSREAGLKSLCPDPASPRGKGQIHQTDEVLREAEASSNVGVLIAQCLVFVFARVHGPCFVRTPRVLSSHDLQRCVFKGHRN